jgi:tRNA A37 threonylcarbamoyltransferase TsaD
LGFNEIDGVAATAGPGLIEAVLGDQPPRRPCALGAAQ